MTVATIIKDEFPKIKQIEEKWAGDRGGLTARLARGRMILGVEDEAKRMSMNKPLFLRSALVFLGLLNLLGAQEDFLKVEASMVPRRLSRGEEGAVILKLSLQEGIAISPKPDFTIEFKSCPELVFPKNFYTATDLGIETEEQDGVESLDLRQKIQVPFTVSEDASKGSHILEGRIKYFAKSQNKEWCVKTSAKFFVPFFTRSVSVKKKT